MVVCGITNKIHTGGAGKSLQILFSHLSRDVQVSILSRSPGHGRGKDGIRYWKIYSGFFPFAYLSGARDPVALNYFAWLCRALFLPRTLRTIRSIHPDVIVLNGFQALWHAPFLPSGSALILYARELLNMDRWSSRLAMKLIDRHIDHIICITENERAQFGEINCPATVVYNSAEIILETVPAVLEKKSGSVFHVGVFGTISHAKGQYLIIDLVEKYLGQVKSHNMHFHIYGGGSTVTTRHDGREVLIERVRKKGLERYITFPGWVKDVSRHMRTMDLILRPDTSGCPWGRDIIEAMSNARPVLAAGSSRVFIRPGENGFLFQPKDIDGMAELLFRMASDTRLMATMSAGALRFARENFSPAENAGKVHEIFSTVIVKKSRDKRCSRC